MKTRSFERSLRFFCCIVLMGAGFMSAVLSVGAAQDQPPLNQYGVRSDNPYLIRQIWENGKLIDMVYVPPCPPPENFKAEAVEIPEPSIALGKNSIPDMPAFNWCYGCSATSAGMAMGHFDRNGYPNMYSGPANGGVCPLNNEDCWANASPTIGECPLVATHMGIDGRVERGYVDDYWVATDSTAPDPFITNVWPEHAHGHCTGDFMGTSQYNNYDSVMGHCRDGGTFFWYDNAGDPLDDYMACEPSAKDGCHGMRQFVESRGYSVTTNYSQYIQGHSGTTPGKGFTFANFQSEIDNGYPVLIQLQGHTMLGIGYDASSSTIYVHDTWDHSDHPMTWGGSYAGMPQNGVTVIHISGGGPAPTPTPPPPTPTPRGPIRVYPDRTSYSGSGDQMYIYAYTDAISTPCYAFVRIVTPYYGTLYLTSWKVIYPYPMPYVWYPIVITSPISGLYLTGLWWRNILPGTYFLESGAVNAWTGNYLGPVHTRAFTLN